MDSPTTLNSYRWACRFAQTVISKLPARFERDDLQSAGIIGYCHAAEHYDPAKGASFRGFCATRIRGAILDELRRMEWAPRSVGENQRRVHVAAISLAAKLQREPTLAELAEVLKVDASDLVHLHEQLRSHQIVSLDEAGEGTGEEEALSLTETIPDPITISPDAAALSAESRRILSNCIRKLPRNEATIIILHYLKEIPLQDIARQIGVHPSRISQLHHQALARLKRTWQHAED